MNIPLNAKLICLLGLGLFLSCPCSCSLSDDNQFNNVISLQYQLETPAVKLSLTPISIDGDAETYSTINIPGLDSFAAPGMPVLPYKMAKILVPYGDEIQEIKVTPGDKTYLGKVLIEPGQMPSPIDRLPNSTIEEEFTPPNESIYNSSDPYPHKAYSVIGVQDKCGYKILCLNLYPLMYIPKTRDVYYFDSFDVELVTAPVVTLERGLFRGSPQDKMAVIGLVDNPELTTTYKLDFVPVGSSLLLGDEQYDYVIITSRGLNETSGNLSINEPGPYNFTTLANWKESRNLTTQWTNLSTAIVTVEDIYDAYFYTGADEQDLIRNFIRDVYLNNNVTFVLLGGDADGSRVGGETWDNTVPARYLWAENFDINSCCGCGCGCYVCPGIPSDLYYACLNGTFDGNENGFYGEPVDYVDLLAEVYVGRAPVDNAEELSNFVKKTISYESLDLNDPYLTSLWMVGEYLALGDVTYWGGNFTDEILKEFPPNVFYNRTLYDRDYQGDCGCNYDSKNWPKYALIDVLNRNIHTLNHVGRNNFCDEVTHVMKMGYNNADSLFNDKFFFGYSQCGYAGSFDNRNSEMYLPVDCVLEHFVTAPCGAFAFIGNSRAGWVSNTIAGSPSQKYNQKFWEAMFDDTYIEGNYNGKSEYDGFKHIGVVNQLSKEYYASDVSSESASAEYYYYHPMRYCYYGLNLLGDPETSYIVPSENMFNEFD